MINLMGVRAVQARIAQLQQQFGLQEEWNVV